MDEKLVRQIEREAADALLDVGISVPIINIKLPFRSTPLTLRLTMKRPTMSGQIAIARTYLDIGVTSEEMWNFTKEEEMQYIAQHAHQLSRMVALCICRRPLKRRLLLGLTSWLIREYMSPEYMLEAVKKFVLLMGTDPFINIIRSVEAVNPMTPRLSQKTKGS